MENLKIRVNTPEERILIQELLFDMGYEWQNYGTHINSNIYVKFIYAKTTKLFFHGVVKSDFIKDPSKQVTIKDLKAMLEHEQKESEETMNKISKHFNHVFDAVNILNNKPFQEGIDKLSKPKHPKVWAWDDDVTEAFETYLIAEFKGMECGFNYLLVHKLQIEKFENKLPFRTDLYKNISQTNPNINPTVEAIAHRIKKEFEKHSELDWAMIAAHKIYSSHIKESK